MLEAASKRGLEVGSSHAQLGVLPGIKVLYSAPSGYYCDGSGVE